MAAFLTASPLSCWGEAIWLSSLDLTSMSQDWGKPRIDLSVGGKPLRIAGQTYDKGVGTHAESAIWFELTDAVLAFETAVGVDDAVLPADGRKLRGNLGTVRFRIIGDGKTLWEANRKAGQPAKAAKVTLEGIRELGLIVEASEDGVHCDHANWAMAKFMTEGGSVRPIPQPAVATVTISPETTLVPRFTGFGQGSQQQFYRVHGNYSPTVQERFLNRLYTLEGNGLGLAVARIYIVAGDDPAFDHMWRRPCGSKNPVGYELADGAIQTNGHEATVWHAQGAARRGASLVAFWNSPPYWMTVSGTTTGSADGVSDNLRHEMEKSFVEHMTRVLRLFRDQWQINFDAVSPINESDAAWWVARKSGQEGCHVGAEQAIRIFPMLRRALQASDLAVKLHGPESAFGNGCGLVQRLLQDDEAGQAIDVLTVHQYITSHWAMRRWHSLAKKHGKELWMSEWGNWEIRNDSSPAAFALHALSYADKIHEAVTVLRSAAWCMWEPAFLFNLETSAPVPRKAFYVVGHFTRSIRPGMRIVHNEDSFLKTVAAMGRNGQSLALITTNRYAAPVTVTYDLSNLVTPSVESAMLTTPDKDLDSVPAALEDGSVRLVLPGRSVASLSVRCGAKP